MRVPMVQTIADAIEVAGDEAALLRIVNRGLRIEAMTIERQLFGADVRRGAYDPNAVPMTRERAKLLLAIEQMRPKRRLGMKAREIVDILAANGVGIEFKTGSPPVNAQMRLYGAAQRAYTYGSLEDRLTIPHPAGPNAVRYNPDTRREEIWNAFSAAWVPRRHVLLAGPRDGEVTHVSWVDTWAEPTGV